MNYEKVEKLLAAGFTAEEIRTMLPEEDKAAQSSGDDSLSDEKASESDKARPAEAESPTINEEIKRWIEGIKKDITGQFEEIKALQQAMNVKEFDTEGYDDETKPKSTIDVYTSIYSKPKPVFGPREGED